MALGLENAAFVGTKTVIPVIESRVVVMLVELVRLTKVVCPFAVAVSERDSGRVKYLLRERTCVSSNFINSLS